MTGSGEWNYRSQKNIPFFPEKQKKLHFSFIGTDDPSCWQVTAHPQ
jgi:hypothetical protein